MTKDQELIGTPMNIRNSDVTPRIYYKEGIVVCVEDSWPIDDDIFGREVYSFVGPNEFTYLKLGEGGRIIKGPTKFSMLESRTNGKKTGGIGGPTLLGMDVDLAQSMVIKKRANAYFIDITSEGN